MKRFAAGIAIAGILPSAAEATTFTVEAMFGGAVEASPVTPSAVIGGDEILPSMIEASFTFRIAPDNPDHFAESDATAFSFEGGGSAPEVSGSFALGETRVTDFDFSVFAFSNVAAGPEFGAAAEGGIDVFGLALEPASPFQLGRATVLALDIFATAEPMTIAHGGPVELLEAGSLLDEFILSLMVLDNDNVEGGVSFVRLRLDGFNLAFNVTEALTTPLPGVGFLMLAGAAGSISFARRRKNG